MVCLLQGKKGIIVGSALTFAIFALVFDPVLSSVLPSTTISNYGSTATASRLHHLPSEEAFLMSARRD
jgi:hypothetical protein